MGHRGEPHSRASVDEADRARLRALGYDPSDPVRGCDIPMMLAAVLARAQVVSEDEIDRLPSMPRSTHRLLWRLTDG